MRKILTTFIGISFLTLSVNAAVVESFENGTGGWTAGNNVSIKQVTVADGAPAAAITEGKYCLEINSKGGKKWEQLIVNKNLSQQIKDSNTLTMDIYLPGSSLPKSGWAVMTVRMFGAKGGENPFDITKKITLKLNKKAGTKYSVEWRYGAVQGFKQDLSWAQIALVKVASGGTMSPIYLDNVQLNNVAEKTIGDLTKDWKLIWQDEFTGKYGDAPAKHWKPGALWNRNGKWRDATLAPEEAFLDGKGNLLMQTRYVDGKRLAPYLVTSETGSYSKEESMTFGPGEKGLYIEWRVNVSEFKAYAAWFALWLFADKPYTGDAAKGSEIDVMEYIPFKCDAYSLMNKFNAAIHISQDSSKSIKPPVPYGFTKFDQTKWHTWGLEWYKDRQIFYLDGKKYWDNRVNVSANNTHGLRMTIEIANGSGASKKNSWGHAVGKFEDNPKERFPAKVYIDYVRIYTKK